MILGLVIGSIAASVAHHFWRQNERIHALEQKVAQNAPAAPAK